MTKQEILFALDVIHPGGAPILSGASWETREDLLECWEGDMDDLPSMADLEFALGEHRAEQSLTAARAATRAALRAQWDLLPPWINGPYRPLFDSANRLLDEGADEAAFEMIDVVEPTAKIANDPEKSAIFAAVKTQFLSVIKSL